MSNPIARLRRAGATDRAASVPVRDGAGDAAVAARRGGGVAAAGLLALAVVTAGAPAARSVDVSRGVVPAADARPASVPATSSEPTFERPAWLREIPLGPAPYYSETAHPFAEYCRGVGWVEVSSTWTNFCQFTDLELPATAGGDFVAKLVVCKDPDLFGPSTLTFATDPEVDLLLWHIDELAFGERPELAYRWSKSQQYAVTPHTVDLHDRCVVHAWHLELADDDGQPLVSGDSYYVEWVMRAPELGEVRSQTRRFVAP